MVEVPFLVFSQAKLADKNSDDSMREDTDFLALELLMDIPEEQAEELEEPRCGWLEPVRVSCQGDSGTFTRNIRRTFRFLKLFTRSIENATKMKMPGPFLKITRPLPSTSPFGKQCQTGHEL